MGLTGFARTPLAGLDVGGCLRVDSLENLRQVRSSQTRPLHTATVARSGEFYAIFLNQLVTRVPADGALVNFTASVCTFRAGQVARFRHGVVESLHSWPLSAAEDTVLLRTSGLL